MRKWCRILWDEGVLFSVIYLAGFALVFVAVIAREINAGRCEDYMDCMITGAMWGAAWPAVPLVGIGWLIAQCF